MPAKILDGKALSETMRKEISIDAGKLQAAIGVQPGLAAVLVGENASSQIYVRNKQKACAQAGFASWLHQLPASTSQSTLLELIAKLNADPIVHGILVQLPLPPQIDEGTIVRAVTPTKDVDGFSPENAGLLAAGHARYIPCTPHGVHQILLRNDIPIEGRRVVVVGRSNIVGKPVALLLMQKARGANATVTVVHSQSRDLPGITLEGDIVIVAIGQAQFLKREMVKPGAVVIDVGINRLPDGKLVGDVDYGPVSEVASAITPVPGGIGPMTITMLLYNTLQAARLLSGNKV
jgi:methylenetetrahydrofolate dehydrogenase (NADP+)/methenyltetrahydrofolate cyclohydrolase